LTPGNRPETRIFAFFAARGPFPKSIAVRKTTANGWFGSDESFHWATPSDFV